MYVFWIIFAIGFLNYLDRNVLTGAADTVAHELGLGIDSIGYIASAFIIVYTVSTIPMGIWADRTKRKNIVALCVAIWSIATALTALSFNFLSLFLSRMVLGIGEAGYFPAGTALLSDYFNREKRSRIMSWWSVGPLIGILFGFAIGGAVAGLYVGSWRLAFIFTGIPGLGLAFLSWRLREPRRNEADEGEQALHSKSTDRQEVVPHTTTPAATNMFLQLRDLLRIKTLVVLIVMQVFAFFVLGVTIVFLPIFLQQKDLYGLSSGAAGLFSGGVIVVAGSIGTIGGGYLADLLSRRNSGARVLVCGIGFLISAPTFVLAMTAQNFVLFTFFFVITTIFVTLYTGPSAAATQDVVPSALRASAVAISLLIAHALGDAFSPTLVGVLARFFDPTGGTHFEHNMAGHDLSLAMLVTCTLALVIAGLVGIIGARWMKGDLVATAEAERLAQQTSSDSGPLVNARTE
jgi:MFS family permease